MDKILALREKRAKAWEAAKAFLDSKRSDSGLLNAEDTATYDKMEAEVIALGKEVDRLERQAAIDRELNQPTSSAITNTPTGDPEGDKDGRGSGEYRRSFWNAMRGKRDATILNALTIGEDSEGGYLTPDEYEGKLVEALTEENIFRTLATTITTSSGDRKIPVAATKGTASWVDEEGQIPEDDDSFGQVSIGAFKLATMIKISEELLGDSAFDLESYIAREFARRIGTREEEGFIIGDGTGKPTGILANKGGAEIGVSVDGANISLDDILDLFYSLNAPYRKSAAFLMNDTTIKAIRKLKDGNGQYLWQPSIRENTPDTLLGRPLHTSAYVPALGEGNKAVAFGDFSYYWVADRSGRVFKRLNELYAPTGQVGFLASQRVDGKLILPEAIKVLQCGTAARSARAATK